VTDTSPTVVLTTSAVFEVAAQYVDDGAAVIAVIAVDTLDLDADAPLDLEIPDGPDIAYLQYTSGSTRLPAGVMISHRNMHANFEQLMAEYFALHGGVFPPGTSLVSWLPFYHDMGLMLGIGAPIFSGHPADLLSPIAFLTRPARWLHAMGRHARAWLGAPNFAFDLTARRTTDAELAGLDLSGVVGIINGSERIHPETLIRFNEHLGPVGFRPEMVLPSYGLAEATVYVASGGAGRVPEVVEFDGDELTRGTAVRKPGGTLLLRYEPRSARSSATERDRQPSLRSTGNVPPRCSPALVRRSSTTCCPAAAWRSQATASCSGSFRRSPSRSGWGSSPSSSSAKCRVSCDWPNLRPQPAGSSTWAPTR
jgi:fatty acid CoA ligase FadD21